MSYRQKKNTASIEDFCQCQPLAALLHSLDNVSAKYQVSAREILLPWWLQVAQLKSDAVELLNWFNAAFSVGSVSTSNRCS